MKDWTDSRLLEVVYVKNVYTVPFNLHGAGAKKMGGSDAEGNMAVTLACMGVA